MENKLLSNEDKTQRIICTPSHSQAEEDAAAMLIRFVIDSWESFIGEVCKKLSRFTFLMRKMKACVREDFLTAKSKLFFNGLLSYINYLSLQCMMFPVS